MRLFPKLANTLILGITIGSSVTSLQASSAWLDQQVDNGRGISLRVYPQDNDVSKKTSDLPSEEKIYFSQRFEDGPRDEEMRILSKSGKDPYIELDEVGTVEIDTPEFDAMHTFAVVRATTNMWRSNLEELLQILPNKSIISTAKHWDKSPEGELLIMPHGYQEKNAFYTRGKPGSNSCFLVFGYFEDSQDDLVYTCRTPDIVAHEAGHYILDRLRPEFYDSKNQQTLAFHEAFGDISVLNFIFSNDLMAQALITSTNCNLRKAENFAAKLAEKFGIALGMKGYLRNANNKLKVSQTVEEPHALSEVFTGAYYDSIVEAFNEATNRFKGRYNPVNLLQDIAEYSRNLLLHAVIHVKSDPDLSDFAEQLDVAAVDWHRSVSIPDSRIAYLKGLSWSKHFADSFEERGVNKTVKPLPITTSSIGKTTSQARYASNYSSVRVNSDNMRACGIRFGYKL